MKHLSGLFVAVMLVAACGGQAAPSGPSSSSDEQLPDPAPSTTSLNHETDTSTPSGPPVAWIAPSGVPLAVTAANGETIEVLTPCGNAAVLTEGTPVFDVDVVIDPGHGGPIDTGAVGATGMAEKDINLRVSLAVRDMLNERGVSSLLTRVADYPVPIRTRSAYSDLVAAEALVSIHHNAPAAPVSDLPGVEIFVRDATPESARLGGLVYDHVMTALGQFDVDWYRAPDAGVMTVLNSEGEDAYGMVRMPDAPSALAELGYIANPAEAELYADPAYVPAVATAVADAIEDFLGSEATGSPLGEGRVFNPARGVGQDQCMEPDLEQSLFPDVVEVAVSGDRTSYTFDVTMSSPYDKPERYADAWQIIGDDGRMYGIRELTHDHANEQPFTRSLAGVEIPDSVKSVTIQGRDLLYGWGGGTFEAPLP
jgi:N-acetylmuramoyl-L-alanine amidase